MTSEKRFLWLAENTSGSYYTWTQEASLPEFTDQLGAGQSQMTVTLPRVWGQIGIPGDAGGQNDLDFLLVRAAATIVSVYIVDDSTAALPGGLIWGIGTWGSSTWGDPPASLGQLLYQGQIEEVEVAIGPSVDSVTVTLLPQHSLISEYLYTSLTFTDADPVDVARSLFDDGYLPLLTWHPDNPTTSGRTITQTFQYQTYRSILDFCTQAAGSGWYNHVDERLRFRMWEPDTTQATHVLQIGREISEGKYLQTVVQRKNQVIARGKGGLISVSQDPHWLPARSRSAVYNLPDVTDQATLNLLAELLLARLNVISVRASLTLISNSGAPPTLTLSYDDGASTYPLGQLSPTSQRGYLLESIRPGDTVQLHLDQGDPSAFIWGVAAWGGASWTGSEIDLMQTPQIVSATRYNGGDTLEIDLSTQQPSIRAAHQRLAQLAEQALGATVV